MSKTRSFSIYLLKEGCSIQNALKDNHGLRDASADAKRLPEGATLFLRDDKPTEPWWKKYFEVQMPLNQAMKGALVFIPASGRIFALSFGHVYHNLDENSYEHEFGLRVTLNCVDPKKLKNTDVLEPGIARRRRTQVSIDSELTRFDFDHDSTVMKSLTGKAKEEHQELIRQATGSSSLRISSAVSAEKLPELCSKLLTLYESDDYKKLFPNIQNITPVRDPQIIAELNNKLVEELRKKSDTVALTIPDMVDYRENVYIKFSGIGICNRYDDVYINNYFEYLDKRDVQIASIDVNDLKKHRLHLVDEDGSLKKNSYPIFKSLIFDTNNKSGQETYYFADGNWYRFDNEYIKKVNAYLDPLYKDLNLPDFKHKNEEKYNKVVSESDQKFLCLDKTNISPTGQTQLEPCDIFCALDGKYILYHVKRSTLSIHLSHLFNQGSNAAEILKFESESFKKLKDIVKERAHDRGVDMSEFTEAVKSPVFEVVFVIITHKDKSKKSINLPLFSRVSLMRHMKAMQRMDIKTRYGFVADCTPRKKED